MGKRRQRLTQHHVVPRARNGGVRDITLWPNRFHASFHIVFKDLLVEECVEMLASIFAPGTFWTGAELRDLRDRIKGGGSPHEYIYDGALLPQIVDGGVVYWEVKFNVAFRTVFGALTRVECAEMVRQISVPGTFWTGTSLRDLRVKIRKENSKKIE